MKYWRVHGIKIVLYIDDGICAAQTYEVCEQNSKFVQDSLANAGFRD